MASVVTPERFGLLAVVNATHTQLLRNNFRLSQTT